MKRLTGRPAADGYRMPAEWEPHDGCVMIWPVRPGSWPHGAREAQEVFAGIARTIARSEKVWMLAGSGHAEEARACFAGDAKVQVLEIPTDDAWARDVGPTCVVNRDGVISDEQAEYLDQLLPLEKTKEAYWAFTADRIKFHTEFDNAFLEANKGAFFSTWFGMLFPNFKEYCVAFLMETAGYWRLGTTNWIVADGIVGYGDTYGIEPANLSERFLGKDWQPVIQEKVEDLQKGDFTGPFYNIASMVWLTLFACALLFARKEGKSVLFLIPLLALWATTMIAAPTYCELRYLYAFFTAIPAVVWLSLPRRKET